MSANRRGDAPSPEVEGVAVLQLAPRQITNMLWIAAAGAQAESYELLQKGKALDSS